ncbi:unnamed protein product [Protopolystoma xenopodis]|uniref:Uncharacterized protein n=1 Tax=Protopolystoma xenopodis TaxID=117903 RepID=A0A448XKR8_9PLAT|nr:unnamed protein product [Protopolystoma xenopodis]
MRPDYTIQFSHWRASSAAGLLPCIDWPTATCPVTLGFVVKVIGHWIHLADWLESKSPTASTVDTNRT